MTHEEAEEILLEWELITKSSSERDKIKERKTFIQVAELIWLRHLNVVESIGANKLVPLPGASSLPSHLLSTNR